VQVALDSSYFKKIDDFSRRFPDGAPSLLGCNSLSVSGDVTFESNVTIGGSVAITNTREIPAVIPSGSLIEKDISF
jgi:UTP--glucose-1-phosphate uridylyltransferase